ncbi:MAG TPA: hypothetical protein VMT86_15355 [Bryobacteraceae bacterium]|nr:hypothetical protein [Bryobacteraceae bacterium]
MRRIAAFALFSAVSLAAWADGPVKPAAATGPTATSTAPDVNPEQIIQKFAAKEKEFAEARDNYTFRQTSKIQELDDSGAPVGKWEIVTDVIFTPEGKRSEHVVYAPVSTLQNLLLTPEDMEDLRNTQPFVLTTDEVPLYDIRYLGKQNADEISCYVFAVKPKKLIPGKRFFEGQIWVDDRDLQIVKTYGKAVGYQKKSDDQQFPMFETLREQIDGKYWFPTYTHADDTLHFKDHDQRIRMLVTYKDYKKFEGKSTIHFGDVIDDKSPDPNKPQPKKPQ